MQQAEKARRFAALHVKGQPLVLYNVWDAGSARVVQAAGAPAIGTSSWALAAAHGFEDGEALPFDLAETIVKEISASIEVPLTVDFEGGYSDDLDRLRANTARIVKTGAVGINFEDRIVKGQGLYGIEQQCRRIEAIRRKAGELGVPLFLNARTDLFLESRGTETHALRLGEAKERAAAYAEAGASGIFVPGLADEGLIADFCESNPLPVNVMLMEGVPGVARLRELGIARVSYGPSPYIAMTAALKEAASAVYGR